jgi:hypothetical protein
MRHVIAGLVGAALGAVPTAVASAGPCGQDVAADPAGLYPLPDGERWGYVTAEGTWALAPQWRQVRPFHEGRAAVETEAGWGVIDTSGGWVVEPGARDADRVMVGETAYHLSPYKPFSQGCSAVTPAQGQAHFVTRDGTRWDPPALAGATVAELGAFGEGLAAATVMTDGEYPEPQTGWIDSDGQWAIEPRRDLAGGGVFSNGVAPAWMSADFNGYIDRTGELVFPYKFVLQDAGPVREGLARLTLNDETGFWDAAFEGEDFAIREAAWPNGEARSIDWAGDFHDGRAGVRVERTSRPVWIDTDGAVRVDPEAGGRLGLCRPTALPRFHDGLLPLMVAAGGNICGQGPDLTFDGEDPRMGALQPVWVMRHPQVRVVWLDRDGAVVLDSTDCRPEPGYVARSATTEDGGLTDGAYRLAFDRAANGETAPRLADAPCNRSEYTGKTGGTNDGGPWRISLSGEAEWQGHPVGASLSITLPAGLSPGTYAFGEITDDDSVSANLWMSRPDAGPQAERPPSFASTPGGELVLERRDTEAATGRFSITLAALEEGIDQTVTVSGRFQALPYTFAPEVTVSEVTGALKDLADEMDDPFAALLFPARAETEGDRLHVTLGKWGPKVDLIFPADQPDGAFTAGPGKPVSVRVGDTPATATGTLDTGNGTVAGTFAIRLAQLPGSDEAPPTPTSMTGAFAHVPITDGGE